ncbi:Sulfatase [Gimesia panareensis]|uniref:Sulfatase n=2 Tax=Gimesia panareensis TaxID=2527978 RepID=A0A518FX40_9PLAN|nr:sulfatase [Gimesia panareensis]QDV20953.1 Sulfatase [Gimesia panareensis]
MNMRFAGLLQAACLCLTVAGFLTNHSQAAETTRPNILFCIADDASYPYMGAYGCTWVKTPAFDRVAREGLLFTNAYTPNAKCAPSRACILTGRNSWQLKEAGNHMAFFPPEFKTYVEALAEHGYTVGKTAKGWAPGVAVDAQGKRRNLAGPAFNSKKLKPPATGISSIDYAGNFAQFLETCPEEKSWCFWYGGFEPHRRYEYGSGAKNAGKKVTDIERVPAYWPDNEVIRNDMLDYAYEVEHFDHHLARMLKLLEQRGELENTLVVVTADNGMPFPRIKGQEYELSNHLPLAIMWPAGIKAPGRMIKDYVSFIDFAPTFIEVAGLKWDQTGMQPAAGHSLTDIFNSTKSGQVNPARDHVLIGKERHDIGRPHDQGYPIRGIVKGGMLYLRNYETGRWPAGNPETGYLNCDGSPTKTAILDLRRDGKHQQFWQLAFGKRPAEELFAIDSDQECMQNLADNPQYQKVKQELKQQLETELKAQQDPRMSGKGGVFEAYQYSDPRTRSFYERYMSGEPLKAGWVNKSDFESGPLD